MNTGSSGLAHAIEPWSPVVPELRQGLQECLGWGFNSLLLNRWRDGRCAMGWHADDAPELDLSALDLSAPCSLPLHSGDQLLMETPSQLGCQHAVPRRLRLPQERLLLPFQVVWARPDPLPGGRQWGSLLIAHGPRPPSPPWVWPACRCGCLGDRSHGHARHRAGG